jgi:hypothetical protein
MTEKKSKNNFILLNFLSCSKFDFKKNKHIFKKFNKLILILWLLKKYKNFLEIKLKNLKSIKKYYILVKSPKNYKKGKVIINSQYFNYLIIIKKKSVIKNLNSSLNYFKYFLNIFKNILNIFGF